MLLSRIMSRAICDVSNKLVSADTTEYGPKDAKGGWVSIGGAAPIKHSDLRVVKVFTNASQQSSDRIVP